MSASPETRTRVAVLDTGIGGLPILLECLMSAPRVSFLFVADEQALPGSEMDPQRLGDRIAAVGRLLIAAGVDIVVLAAAVFWPHLDRLAGVGLKVLDPVKAVHQALKETGPGKSRAIAPGSLLGSATLRRISDLVDGLVLTSSDGLAPIVDRQPGRDELTMEAVRRVAAPFADGTCHRLLLLDSHAGVVQDLFCRALPTAVVADLPAAMAHELADALGATPGPNPEPHVEIWVTGGFSEHVRIAATEMLQIPDLQASVVEIESVNTGKTSQDLAVLAYAAFDDGGDELDHYVAPGARLRGGGDLRTWARSCRRRLPPVRTQIEELLVAGDRVGVVGRRLMERSGEPISVPFSHMLTVTPGGITELVIDDDSCDPTPPL